MAVERTRKIRNAFIGLSASLNLGSAQDLQLIESLSARTGSSDMFFVVIRLLAIFRITFRKLKLL